ncbi:MAG: LytTR family DNA-binding domain-containing protein [Bacillota bacterium]|nr:LytTR family DNA-binding domain-containing protein [Bacillota bacterium]
MKLTLQEEKNHELEVIVVYSEPDNSVKRLIEQIKVFDITLPVYGEDRCYKLNISDIYYIETVDRKVFVYTKHDVYRSDRKLYQLETELAEYGYTKVNKSCLLNIKMLKAIKNIYNSRLEAELINGDRLNVSRMYIPKIREALL